jgi:hypothetical protein
MQDFSKEILEKYQVRKTKAQKTEFIEFMRGKYPDMHVEKGGFGNNRNIVIGDVASAKAVFTAHYDTCARLPFPNFITPKNILFYLLYSILIVIPFFAFSILVEIGLVLLHVDPFIAYVLSLIVLFGSITWVFMLGTPNKHTANDNTSGVVALCELMASLPEEQRKACAFVFFDNEENGLFGSSFFAKLHAKEMREKLLINLDCVGDGDNIMLVTSKQAAHLSPILKSAFPEETGKHPLFESSSSAFYPSDQINFKKTVAVAALKKNKLLGYYMDRIHTKKDTVCDERNIEYLCRGFSEFLENYGT